MKGSPSLVERKAKLNLLRLIGQERFKRLFRPPFELRIPGELRLGWGSRLDSWPDLAPVVPVPYEWILSPEGNCWLVRSGERAISKGREFNYFCVHPAFGFARVPAADKVLALFLWIKADEKSFIKRVFPGVSGMERKNRLEQWDALVATPSKT